VRALAGDASHRSSDSPGNICLATCTVHSQCGYECPVCSGDDRCHGYVQRGLAPRRSPLSFKLYPMVAASNQIFLTAPATSAWLHAPPTSNADLGALSAPETIVAMGTSNVRPLSHGVFAGPVISAMPHAPPTANAAGAAPRAAATTFATES
jgi:hypothetical protein